MRTTSTRRTLVALATAAALLPAGPALGQTAAPTPTATATVSPAPAPVAPQIQVDRTLVDVGGVHRLTVTGAAGAAGAAVQLFGNDRQIRTATLPASGRVTWELRPGARTVFSAVVDGRRTSSVTVEVRRTVTIGVSQPTRGVYVFTGQVQRAEAGLQVTVARLDSETGRVTGVASTRTDGAGRYAVRTGLPVGFAGYYALTGVTSAALQPGRSRLYGLLVNTRPAAVPTISLDVGRGPGYYLFSGALTPGRSVPVTLARVVDGRLVGVAGGRTAANGGYVFRVPVAPGTHFFQVITSTTKSRVYGLVVPPPVVPACSARSPRKSFDDSAQCLFRAYRAGDWAAVANYALPPVIALLRDTRASDVENGFAWSYSGCGEPQYEDIGEFPPASSGVACEFYLDAGPGEVHGVALELNMDRFFRAESYTTVG